MRSASAAADHGHPQPSFPANVQAMTNGAYAGRQYSAKVDVHEQLASRG